MEAPQTRYARRDDHHISYQVWGSGPIDVLEFNNGLMISIDETFEEPSWLRYEESLASFCRLIRFDALGLGLSDPLPTGMAPSIEAWAADAMAVLDEVGVERADMLAPAGARCWPCGWRPISPSGCAPSSSSTAHHGSSGPTTTRSGCPTM
jgi:hypothetical protein